jgi:TolA-binding protein
MKTVQKNYKQKDDFEKDAQEGWDKMYSSKSLLNDLDRKYKNGNPFRLLIALGGVLVLIALLIVFTQLNKNKHFANKSERNTFKEIERTDFKIPIEISKLEKVNYKKRIKIKEIKKKFIENKKNIHLVDREKEDISSLKPRTLKSIEQDLKKEIVVKELEANEIYVEDLLLIDYSKIRKNYTIRSEQLTMNGLPANFENETKNMDELDWENVQIPYNAYIEKSIKLFSKSDYKKALTRFEEILKNYPDDLNALFYGALCYFNLGQFSKAEKQFKQCIHHKYSNFKEDGVWFLAKTLIEKKEFEQAKEILQEIVSSKTYYEKDAQKLLLRVSKP